MLSGLRSALFFAGFFAITPPFALLIFAFWHLPYRVREDTARLWCRASLLWLRICCGVRHRVIGLENLPPGPAFYGWALRALEETPAPPACRWFRWPSIRATAGRRRTGASARA